MKITSPFEEMAREQAKNYILSDLLKQLSTYIGIGGALFCLFCFLRPYNNRIYSLICKSSQNKNTNFEPLPKKFFSWILIIKNVKDDDIRKKLGVDAAIFLEFIKLELKYSIFMLILTFPLYFFNYFCKLNKSSSFNKPSAMDLSVVGIKPDFLYVHLIVNWISAFYLYFLIFNISKYYIKIRQSYLNSNKYKAAVYSKTVIVENVPKELRNEIRFEKFVQNLKLSSRICSCGVNRRMGDLSTYYEKHCQNVKLLNRLLQKMASGNLNLNKTPHHRPKIYGKRVDSIEFYLAEISKYNKLINTAIFEKDKLPFTDFGFITFYDACSAHLSIKELLPPKLGEPNKDMKGMTYSLAPCPKDLIWQNREMPKKERRIRKFFYIFVYVLLVVFGAFPIFLIDRLSSKLSTDNNSSIKNTTIKVILRISFAPMLLLVYTLIVQKILRKLCYLESASTYTAIERTFFKRFYSFTLFNTLFVLCSIQPVMSTIEIFKKGVTNGDIKNDFIGIVNGFIDALLANSSFWIMKITLNTVVYTIELLQVVTLSKTYFYKKIKNKIYKKKSSLKNKYFNYSVIYAIQAFNFTVFLLFSIPAPFLVWVGALNFSVAYFVFKHQLIYVYKSSQNDGANLFKSVLNQIILSSIVAQILNVTIIVMKGDDTHKMLALPLPVISTVMSVSFSSYISSKITHLKNSTEFSLISKRDTSYYTENKKALDQKFEHPVLKKAMTKIEIPQTLKNTGLLPKELMIDLEEKEVQQEYNDYFEISSKKDESELSASSLSSSFEEILPENNKISLYEMDELN